MTFKLPKIYPITDTSISGLSHREQVEQLIDGGAEIVQLRDKTAGPREFYAAALDAMAVARARGVRLIINDRVDIAIAVGADGVHVGQHDLPPAQARQLLGNRIIGYSTHNLDQVNEALSQPVDYIAFGPIFTTSTKENPDQVTGLQMLERVARAVGNIPLVAIGGIDERNLLEVFRHGANSAAMISVALKAPSIADRLINLRQLVNNC